jgi:para-aminobenzoate synthetase/4-amino-4-deoxychorismate lyase
MAALFPCASITGAPKVSTMKIITALETSPRGLYTGCIGYLSPGRQAQFNVAIRTVVVDKASNTAEYGVGGGIVWDSKIEEEYHECQTKARILTDRRPEFQLLETMLWTPAEGYFLLDEHLRRLGESAVYFDYEFDEIELRGRLAQLALELPNSSQKVRLLAGRDGQVLLESGDVIHKELGRVGLAAHPVDSSNVFLYHKTTRRDVYEEARASRPDCQEVLLWNERGQITEASTSNVVVKLGSRLLTPPVDCGLLRGTFRDWLLREGVIEEAVITVEDLEHCQALYLINSVRKWREADLGQEWPDRAPAFGETYKLFG